VNWLPFTERHYIPPSLSDSCNASKIEEAKFAGANNFAMPYQKAVDDDDNFTEDFITLVSTTQLLPRCPIHWEMQNFLIRMTTRIISWIEDGETVLKKKGQGQGLKWSLTFSVLCMVRSGLETMRLARSCSQGRIAKAGGDLRTW
jgi:hypothetical protein